MADLNLTVTVSAPGYNPTTAPVTLTSAATPVPAPPTPAPTPTPTPSPTPSTLGLVQSASLVYAGAFNLPTNFPSDGQSFNYGGGAIAFTPRGTLLVAGFDPAGGVGGLIGEVTIPAPIVSTSPTGLNVAALTNGLTALVDPFGGKMGQVEESGNYQNTRIGGFAFVNGKLIVSVYVYYDGSGAATLSHFVVDPAKLTYIGGPYQVGSKGAGWVAGSMQLVPPSLVAAVGGPLLTGQNSLSVTARTSQGPSAFAFDPTQLGVASPVPAAWLLGYPMDNPSAPAGTPTTETLGPWAATQPFDGTKPLWNGASAYQAAAVIDRSLIFLGPLGTGTWGYGMATNDPSMAGQSGAPDPAYPNWLYDPTAAPPPSGSGPGVFDSSYQSEILAYDLNDLAAVKAGTKNPWDVVPYAAWSITLPFGSVRPGIRSMAFDPATRRLFVVQGFGNGPTPVVHVYQVATSA